MAIKQTLLFLSSFCMITIMATDKPKKTLEELFSAINNIIEEDSATIEKKNKQKKNCNQYQDKEFLKLLMHTLEQ